MSEEVKCVDCGEVSIGWCESCNAAICDNCEAGEFDDVYTCKNITACSARIDANEAKAKLVVPSE